MQRLLVGCVIVGALVVGLGIGWSVGQRNTDEAIVELSLVQELARVSLTVGILQLLRDENPAKAQEVLDEQLSVSLTRAARLLGAGAQVTGSIPSIREGVRRASEYSRPDAASDRHRTAEYILDQLAAKREDAS